MDESYTYTSKSYSNIVDKWWTQILFEARYLDAARCPVDHMKNTIWNVKSIEMNWAMIRLGPGSQDYVKIFEGKKYLKKKSKTSGKSHCPIRFLGQQTSDGLVGSILTRANSGGQSCAWGAAKFPFNMKSGVYLISRLPCYVFCICLLTSKGK